jgi:acyl-coenzyme A synthetase/AMP-(fatty) acid ligase
MNLTELFMERVTLSPRQIALIAPGAWKTRSFSFADLEAASANVAQCLRQSGFGKGDRILLLLPVSIELYIVLLALFRL